VGCGGYLNHCVRVSCGGVSVRFVWLWYCVGLVSLGYGDGFYFGEGWYE